VGKIPATLTQKEFEEYVEPYLGKAERASLILMRIPLPAQKSPGKSASITK